MKKLITLLLLAFTMFSCSTEEAVQRINPVAELSYPQESDPAAECPCVYIVLSSQQGDGSEGTIYTYSMDCQGNPQVIIWQREEPIPQSQLEVWMCE